MSAYETQFTRETREGVKNPSVNMWNRKPYRNNEFKALEPGWENDVELEEWIPLFRGHSPANWKKGMAWRYADTPAYPSRLFTNFEPSWHQDRVYYVDSKAIK